MTQAIRPRRRSTIRAVLIALPIAATLAALGTTAHAQSDRGLAPMGRTTRNFRVESAALPREWGEGGPRQRWRRPLGEGYSSVLVDGEMLVTMYRRADTEVIVALDAATGSTRWEHAYAAPLDATATSMSG